jgi:hypothetical protein
MRSALISSTLLLTMAGLLAACSFSVDRPEQFKTVDNGKDVTADVGDPDISLADNGPDVPPPTCSNDGDCPAAEEMCFAARCIDGECSIKPDKGAKCEDGNKCTHGAEGDKCNINGQCAPGAEKMCEPSDDPCLDMVCLPLTGECEGVPLEGCPDCASFGDDFFLGEWECCPDLSESPACFGDCPPGADCCDCDKDIVICLNCGNGVCEEPESWCNCEADCGLPEPFCEEAGGECFEEFCPPDAFEIPGTIGCDDKQLCCKIEALPCLQGGDVGFKEAGDACCEQFDSIPFVEDPEGDCNQDEGLFVCAKCGDQQCQVEWEENACNCPMDCMSGDCGSGADCNEGKSCFKGECIYCTPEVCNGLDDDCDGDIDEDCEECGFAEMCKDDLDNDCDGQIDEGVCVNSLCPSELPGVYLKAALHKIAKTPDDISFLGKPVAVSGRVGGLANGCGGDPDCQWPMVLREQGVVPAPAKIVVGPSDLYKEVFCLSADAGLIPDTCLPIEINKVVVAWGVWEKASDNSGGFALSLHGFCIP